MLINEAEIFAKWAPILENEAGITDRTKVKWLAKYCHIHELFENGQLNENNNYAQLPAVNGMGDTR